MAAREELNKEVERLLEAASAGLPLSPSLELENQSFEKSKTNLKIIGCSGGEVERKAGDDESADGGGPNIRLICILFIHLKSGCPGCLSGELPITLHFQ